MYRRVFIGSLFAAVWSVSGSAQCIHCANTTAIETYASQETVVGEVVPAGSVTVDGVVERTPIEGTAVAAESIEGVVTSQNPVETVSYETVTYEVTPRYGSVMMNNVSDALAIVNRKRSRRGLPALQYDSVLTSVAQQKSANRASRRITGHDNLPKGGARVEGVGYAYGRQDLPSQFNTCYLYSTGYRRAGAAISYDGSGRHTTRCCCGSVLAIN